MALYMLVRAVKIGLLGTARYKLETYLGRTLGYYTRLLLKFYFLIHT